MAMFLTDQIQFSFVEGHPVTISAFLPNCFEFRLPISEKKIFKVFVTMISNAPWWPCFLTDQISSSYFCSRSPSDHFCQIIFNSDHWFQRRFLKFSHRDIMETGHASWWPCILMDQIRFSYFCIRSPSDYF